MTKKKHKAEEEIPFGKEVANEINVEANSSGESQNEQISEVKIKSPEEELKDLKELVSQQNKVISELGEEKEQLNVKFLEMSDKYLRANAEFDNLRKRTVREKNDIRQLTLFDTVNSFLPIIDHFDLALKSNSIENIEALLKGMELIKSEFYRVLSNLGIKEIESVGKNFDPNVHDAIANEFSDEFEANIVSKQWKAGYMLGEKVLRPAAVVVSNGKAVVEHEKVESEQK